MEVPSAKDASLDIGLTYEGMLRELRALESRAVDVIWHVDPKQKVISTRWVSNAKAERVEGRDNHIVRCRVVARVLPKGQLHRNLGFQPPLVLQRPCELSCFMQGPRDKTLLDLMFPLPSCLQSLTKTATSLSSCRME